jgi:putative DNA primase/helicase
MDARHVARLLGGVVVGRDRVLAPGPGHRSRKDRSLSIRVDDRAPDGFVVVSFAGDDWRDCKDYVRQCLNLSQWQPGGQDQRIPSSRVKQFDVAAVNAEADEGPRWTEDDVKRINQARAIWRDGVNPAGTLAETYLRQHRKIELDAGLAGTVLRYSASCPWHDEDSGQTITVPALIAAFRSIDDDTITGIQRVRLGPDGHKIDRRMLGVTRGAAVKLDSAGKQLSVGEGIETCLAGRQLGLSPVWALGSVGAISFLPIIEDVQRLIILGEAGEASADAIKMCGERWLRAGRKVRIAMPDDGCNDLNDELMARTAP